MLTWSFFYRYLFSRRAGALIKIISWLCILGVGIGLFAFVVVLSVMNGLHKGIQERFLSAEPHLVVTVPEKNNYQDLIQTMAYQMLRSDLSVQSYVFEKQDVILRTADGIFGGAIAKGMDEKSLDYVLTRLARAAKSTNEVYFTSTTDLEFLASSLQPGEILIGVDLASSLGILDGDTLVVVPPESLLLPTGEIPEYDRVKVKKIISTNVPDVDSKFLFYIRGKTLKRLADSASLETAIEVWLPDPQDYGVLKGKLEKTGAKVESWADRNSTLFHSLLMEKAAMGTFLGLGALIAGFSIITVLALLLSQKRRDIGILMALGLSPQKTQKLFRTLGFCLAGVGIFLGLISALIVCWFLSQYSLKLPDIYYESKIPVALNFWFIVCVVILGAGMAFLGAYLPTYGIDQMDPSEVLRIKIADESNI